MPEPFRVYATCDIGHAALDRLRERGYAVEVHPKLQPPSKRLVLQKLRTGIDALITTLRDNIDEEVFAAGAASGLKVVAQIAVGFDNIDRAWRTATASVHPHAHVLTDATAEFAFFLLGAVARRLYPAELRFAPTQWSTWHPHLPWLGDEVTGRTLAVVGMGRIGNSMVPKATDSTWTCCATEPLLRRAQRPSWRGSARGRTCARARGSRVGARDRDRPARRRAAAGRLRLAARAAHAARAPAKEPTFHLIDEEHCA